MLTRVYTTILLVSVALAKPQNNVVVDLDRNEFSVNFVPSYNSSHMLHGNQTQNLNDGICHMEVPTGELVQGNEPVPQGNGSRPGYSRIQICCKGYKRNKYIFKRCDPVCEHPCINGNCTAPNTCTCSPNHVKDLSGACTPTCPQQCLNGYCRGDACVCNPGYTLDSTTEQFCVPVCRSGCIHGNCTQPDICACNRGFDLTPEGTCRAGCENCDNGECVGPNKCVCFKGYSKNAEGFCAPLCSRGCKNGVCAAPEVCACTYGFELIESTGVCQPKCLRPCINGFCSGPDTCSCNDGYKLDENDPIRITCVPDCPNGCENGVCSAPNFCICNFGYIKDKRSQKCVKQQRSKREGLDEFERIKKMLIFEIPDEELY